MSCRHSGFELRLQLLQQAMTIVARPSKNRLCLLTANRERLLAPGPGVDVAVLSELSFLASLRGRSFNRVQQLLAAQFKRGETK